MKKTNFEIISTTKFNPTPRCQLSADGTITWQETCATVGKVINLFFHCYFYDNELELVNLAIIRRMLPLLQVGFGGALAIMLSAQHTAGCDIIKFYKLGEILGWNS